MKKVFCIFVLVSLTAFLLINALSFGVSAEPDLPVHNIDTGLDYASIQEAIDDPNTSGGHMIQVDAGMYREHVVANKSVKLVGENKFDTVVDGEDAGTVIYITADNVEITGFTIQNSSSVLGGIFAYRSDGINISHNIIKDNYFGIYLNYSSNNVLSGNNVSNNYSGLYFESSSNNVLSGNNVSNIWDGIHLESSSNNVISGNNLSENEYGVYLGASGNNVLSGNVALNNSYGIWLNASSNNLLLDNDASNNDYGFRTVGSTNNTLMANTASNNYLGVFFESSGNNTVFHNNFIDNTLQVRVTPGFTNTWDTGYPSGGNLWSDYTGTDHYLGLHQNVTGRDGIGDIPYVIDASNTDYYPLTAHARYFSFAWEEDMYRVSTICNSTISGFQFDGSARMINFNVAGPNNTLGFCRVAIPYSLINGPYLILVDGEEANATVLPISNGTHAFLYFTYVLSTREVTIASKPYYELLEKYNSLNSTLYGLLDQYAELFVKHARLQGDYDSLNATYYGLQGDYEALNASYYLVLGDYDSLQIVFNTLLGQYNTLNSSYNNLLVSFDELQSKYDVTSNEIAGIRNVIYVFIATTVIGVAVLLPFGVKYYRVSNKQKEIIQAYRPMDIARVLFRADVERRGVKIGKFEEKYGVKIRPRDTLEDVIRSLELKEKVKR